jgi:acyl-CoA-binding protein
MNRKIGVIGLYATLLIGAVLISRCAKNETTPTEPETLVPVDSPKLPSRGFFMGMLPTPSQGQSFDDAYAQAARYSEFVPVWGRPTPFYNLAAELNGDWGQTFVKKLIRDNGMFPIVHMSFIGSGVTLVMPPGMENATLSDPAWRATYKQAALDVMKASRPGYLSLGNEVNRWYEKYGEDGPNGFTNYVSLYNEIYDAVKKLSPETKVFCVLAREIVSEHREANLEVLRLFNPNKMDLLVFSSYPYALGKTNPSMVPHDYYSKASDYMPGKPFGFSEIAWPSLDALGGEQAQADFITQVTGRLTRDRGINLQLFGWPWLHDLDENDATGLIEFNGTEKLGYAAWKNISGK